MAKIWTREENELLKELTLKGKSRQEVADIFGVTVSSIQNKVRRMKLTRKPNKNIRFFKDIDTEEKAYWLGFIYADGYVVYNKEQGNYELGIELSDIDKEHLSKFNKHFNNELKISSRQRIFKNGKLIKMCNIRIYSRDLVEDLISNKVVPNKTYSNIFPIIEDEKLFFHFFLLIYFYPDGILQNHYHQSSIDFLKHNKHVRLSSLGRIFLFLRILQHIHHAPLNLLFFALNSYLPPPNTHFHVYKDRQCDEYEDIFLLTPLRRYDTVRQTCYGYQKGKYLPLLLQSNVLLFLLPFVSILPSAQCRDARKNYKFS